MMKHNSTSVGIVSAIRAWKMPTNTDPDIWEMAGSIKRVTDYSRREDGSNTSGNATELKILRGNG